MNEFIKRLIYINQRDLKGLFGWFILSLLFNVLTLPIMIIREIYQYKHYHLNHFEWEDVIRYSLVIILGSVIGFLIISHIII